MMRALTQKRPWPALVCVKHPLAKRTENRTRRTANRGLVALHAGKGWDDSAWAFVNHLAIDAIDDVRTSYPRALREMISWRPAYHPTGVVAVVELVDVCEPTVPPRRCGCDPWAIPGKYHWRLGVVYPLPEPVPCLGNQGWWYLPPEAEQQVRNQVSAEWWQAHCPNRGQHTFGPEGYDAFDTWCRRMSRTHTQRQCPDCGLWAIWAANDGGQAEEMD